MEAAAAAARPAVAAGVSEDPKEAGVADEAAGDC